MKKSVLTLIVLALTLGVCAMDVSTEMAVSAANAWVLRNESFGAGRTATGRVVTVCDTNDARTVLWHQVSMSGDGCLIMAPVTDIEPVVIALDNDVNERFGELPAEHPLRTMLVRDMRMRLRLLGLYQEDRPKGPSLSSISPARPAADVDAVEEWASEQRAKWSRLGVGSGPSLQAAVGLNTIDNEVCVVKGFEKGGRITAWDQDGVFSKYTPGHAVCGCVATACGAIVEFFGATNSLSYYGENCTYRRYPEPSWTKEGPLDWEGDRDEARSLTAYNAGVGVDMNWELDGRQSGAMEDAITNALISVFGFKHARYVDFRNPQKPDPNVMKKLIYGQCAAGAPVGMGIEGHSVLAVGYGIDSDGVDRVKVFMGWGGSGDGWYALPNIDTRATIGGSSYLSQVVDGVVTMIAYDNDDIVPVVGQATMGGVEITFDDVSDLSVNGETGVAASTPRIVETSADGWFATRVPPSTGRYTISCIGRTAEYSIGADARGSTDQTRLANAIPDWIMPFSLLNSTVRYSLDSAIEAALAEGKAILRVSGSGGNNATKIVLHKIYEMDQENFNDFTNRYVYYFVTATDAEGDMSPSYTVLLPQTTRSDWKWYYRNGRLSYGYAAELQSTNMVVVTNVVDAADDPYGIGGEVVTTNFTTYTRVSTFAPTGGTPRYEEIPEGDDASVTNIVEQSLLDVMNIGWDQYELRSPGISLEIATSDGSTINYGFEPALGLHADCYRTNETIVATAEGEVTNETGVVFGCDGWTLTNKTTGVVITGRGTSCSIAMEKGDDYVLIWNVVKKYVWIEVQVSQKDTWGVVEPSSGWFPCGEYVTFTATPSEKFHFASWNAGDRYTYAPGGLFKNLSLPHGLPEDAFISETSLSFLVDRQMSVRVEFGPGEGTAIDPSATYTLTMVSYGAVESEEELDEFTFELLSGAPGSKITGGGPESNGKTLADGESVTVNGTGVKLVPESATFIDGDGRRWWHSMWVLYDGSCTLEELLTTGKGYITSDYYDATARFSLKQDATLVRIWMVDEDEDEEEIFAPIAWNAELNNLKVGSNILVSSAELDAHPDAKIVPEPDAADVPLGWKLDGKPHIDDDGNYVAVLELDEEVLAPKGVGGSVPLTIYPNADGTLTVEAKVSNAVRGFWYSLYSSDELGAEGWSMVTSGYTDGEPSVQQKTDDPPGVGEVRVWIKVKPEEQRRFYKLVVED